ncbi:MAG TPA: OB-fold domain-containing protein [Ilumatobacteraceae bacterium]|nr:OB-fold domain-containing protein [Ilumatobacteraceae bacterium]
MSKQIPLVDYLVLGDEPHLVAQECTSCGARFFGRRNACASCFATDFKDSPVATDGTLTTFTIVSFAAPGVPVPFVAGIVDCDGTSVRGNVVNCDPTPEVVKTGMKVRLTTFPLGTDDNGVEAIGYGFEPAN